MNVEPSTMGPKRLQVGMITGAHGLGGLVRVRSFTDVPEHLATYKSLSDDRGKPLSLTIENMESGRDRLLARVDAVTDRNRAEALKGTKLYIDRADLPEPGDDDFYHADLIGLAAESTDGQPCGTVIAIHNFGAGDVLEIRGKDGDTMLLPFTREAVPEIHIRAGRMVINPPTLTDAVAEPDSPDTPTAVAAAAGTGGES